MSDFFVVSTMAQLKRLSLKYSFNLIPQEIKDKYSDEFKKLYDSLEDSLRKKDKEQRDKVLEGFEAYFNKLRKEVV